MDKTPNLLPDSVSNTLKTLKHLIPAAFIGMCPGLCLWLLFNPGDIELLNDNDIEASARNSLLVAVVVSMALALVSYFVAYKTLAGKKSWTFESACRTFNGYAILLPVFPVLLFLTSADVVEDHPFIALFACAGSGAVFAMVAYRIAQATNIAKFKPPHARWVAFSIVIVASAAYAIIVSRLQIIHHENLGTDGDLSFYVNTLWQTIHGHPMKCTMLPGETHASRHFDPVLILMSPIMLIAPRAETAMIFQAVWLALGAIPLYLIACHRLGSRSFGIALSAVYLLHPALHGLNMFDFHSISLTGPVALWLVYLLETNRLKTYFAVFAFFLLFREDMPIIGCFIGLYALISGRPARVGIATIVGGLVYFALVKLVFMSGAKSYSDYFSDLIIPGESLPKSILITVLTNPMYIVRQALSEQKITYLLQLLVPVLGLPLFSGKMRVLFLYGLGFVLAATKPAVFSLAFQYSIVLLPFLLASVPAAIKNIREKKIVGFLNLDPRSLSVALTVGMLASSIAVSCLWGVFFAGNSFEAGYVAFHRNPTESMKDRFQTISKIAAMIPDEASVSASEHVSPHFAARAKILFFRYNPHADYVIVWDKDVNKEKRARNWEEIRKSDSYRRVLAENGIYLYRRK